MGPKDHTMEQILLSATTQPTQNNQGISPSQPGVIESWPDPILWQDAPLSGWGKGCGCCFGKAFDTFPTKPSWLFMSGMGGQLAGEKVAGLSGPEGGKWGWIQLVPSHWWCSPGPILFDDLIHDLDPGWALMILRPLSNPNDSIPLESKGPGNEEHLMAPWAIG